MREGSKRGHYAYEMTEAMLFNVIKGDTTATENEEDTSGRAMERSREEIACAMLVGIQDCEAERQLGSCSMHNAHICDSSTCGGW
jgi:hypothetical protein